VLTTYTGDVQVLRGMKAGAQAHLLKNLPEELLKAVEETGVGDFRCGPRSAAGGAGVCRWLEGSP